MLDGVLLKHEEKMETKTTNWYLRRQKKKKEGPYTSQQIRDLDEKGRLTKDMFAWRKGLEKWVPITRIKGLQFKQKRSWWQFFKEVTFEPIPSGWRNKFVWSLKKIAVANVMIFAISIAGTIGMAVVGGVALSMMAPEQRQAMADEMAEARAKEKEGEGKDTRLIKAAVLYATSKRLQTKEQFLDAAMDYYHRNGGKNVFNARTTLNLAVNSAQRKRNHELGKW
jgi:hypothetical protein